MTSIVSGDLKVTGTLRASSFAAPPSSVDNSAIVEGANIARSKLAQVPLARVMIPWTAWRIATAMHTNLPGTSSGSDLALVGGTFGTGSPAIETSDLKGLGLVTRYCRAQIQLPDDYDDGETVKIRVHGGMVTTVADTSATVDVECRESDKFGGVGAEICATDAASINSLTAADKDFDISPTGLAAGDVLDIRLAVAVDDGAGLTEVKARLGLIELLYDRR